MLDLHACDHQRTCDIAAASLQRERPPRNHHQFCRRIVPVRWIGEQHVREDLGFIPSFADWVKAIRPEPWMGRAQKIEQRSGQQ